MKLYMMFMVLLVVLCANSVHAKISTKTVPYRHGSTELEGFLAYDAAIPGTRPGVLVVHEWWGLNDYAKHRAEQLAALGYVAFAVDMYGKGKVTALANEASEWAKQITQDVSLWQQRALAGLEAFKKEAVLDTRRIAAIGYCFGGSTVQQLAYTGADLKGIVSFHGSLLTPTDEQFKQIKAKFLICHGAADPLITQETLQNYLAVMGKSGLDWQMVIFGGAKHGFTNPDADKAGMAAVGYNKLADQRSWKYMNDFFGEILAQP
jgi:dienelactone hydrolase